jgi:serine/threonine-protein kinase
MEGTNINGYIVKKFLGQGTFGNTWLVEKDNQNYAMKLFKNEMIRSSTDELRIEREIKSLQNVVHTNVIKYIDDGVFSLGYEKYRYLVMEYAQGEPLRNYIQKNGRLSISESEKIIYQVLEGLQAIHSKGFLHRDLKPDNIFLTNLGDIKILDFGLVKMLDASTLTATGATMGTYAYMAPEQLKDSKNIDTRSDLYSVGAILYHMLTGLLPIEINNIIEAPYKILQVIPKPASSLNPIIPIKLDTMISNLLEKEPYWRKFSSAEALLIDLRSLEDKNILDNSSDLTLRLLPRLLNTERKIIENFINDFGLDGIVFPANLLPKYKGVYEFVQKTNGHTIIDPLVYRLAYSKFSNTKSLVDLPYVLNNNTKERPEDFDTVEACRARAKKVVDWQHQFNSSVIVAPFHYIDGINDPWIDKDLIVFNECRKYMESANIKKPLYIGMSMHIESVADSISANRLVNQYTKVQSDGYILMLDIELESMNKAHYFWFTKIVNMLSAQHNPIILSRVNDFALGLTAFGATSISAGIGYIESFKESILIDENKGFGLKPKYYIPQLLSCFNEQEVSIIFEPSSSKELICHCPYCKGSSDINHLFQNDVTKGHYLYKKQEQMQILNQMGKQERYRWIENKISTAIELTKSIKKSTSKGGKIQYKYLEIWLETYADVKSELDKLDASSIMSIM